jgi:DNA polymerase
MSQAASVFELQAVRREALACQRCDLWQTRTRVVMGEGDPASSILLIGEGPGEDEDDQGRPFVGRAGQLLDTALEEAGLSRDGVYITNVVRCRPTEVKGGRIANRAPRANEVRACEPWRWLELNLVAPRVVVCIGAPAARTLIDKKFKLTEQRGELLPGADGRLYIATLHPAYVLRLRSADRQAYTRARAQLIEDLHAADVAAAS